MERSHNFNNGKRSQEVSPTLKCYKCNQPGHIKANCPSNESWPEKNEKKSYKERRSKKAYIAWDDNDSSNGSKEEIMSLWSKFLKPKLLLNKMEKKKVKEDVLVEEVVNMVEEEEIVTIVIIMKKVINPLEVMKEEEVETILEEQMKVGMINITLNVSISISMVIFHGSVKPILNAIIAISMTIFLGSVNPMLKKKLILLMRKKKMKRQHYC